MYAVKYGAIRLHPRSLGVPVRDKRPCRRPVHSWPHFWTGLYAICLTRPIHEGIVLTKSRENPFNEPAPVCLLRTRNRRVRQSLSAVHIRSCAKHWLCECSAGGRPPAGASTSCGQSIGQNPGRLAADDLDPLRVVDSAETRGPEGASKVDLAATVARWTLEAVDAVEAVEAVEHRDPLAPGVEPRGSLDCGVVLRATDRSKETGRTRAVIKTICLNSGRSGGFRTVAGRHVLFAVPRHQFPALTCQNRSSRIPILPIRGSREAVSSLVFRAPSAAT